MSDSRDPAAEFVEELRRRAKDQNTGSGYRAEEHQLAAGFWGVTHRGLTTTAAVASAVAGTTLLASTTGAWRIVAGVLALVAAGLSTLDTTLKAGQLAEGHKHGYDGFTRMRTKWLQFQAISLRLVQNTQELAAKFESLVTDRDQLSEQVPAPPQWAKRRVRRRRKREKVRKQADQLDRSRGPIDDQPDQPTLEP